ncbi:hypothetical protein [Enterococcus sp. 5H]|uniref:hypothetical protein n=1 Tax=Enterococcus sp. 5H TaxID=1229490 RepID=UPI0023029E98|nr:hypothetical protein [Enterococcus sp. 5H]MDA9471378.1 hypothetical protein [Enterococcus sp. 5H]
MKKSNKVSGVFLGVVALLAMVSLMFTGGQKTEAASYLSNLTVKESSDGYVVRYNVGQVQTGASIHLSIMSQQGKILADKGIIEIPKKAGMYEYEISKQDIKLNEGFIIEYQSTNNKILAGFGKHLVSINGINYF